MKSLTLLLFLFTALATAADGADGGGSGSGNTPGVNVEPRSKDAAWYLKVKCKSNADCAAGTGACSKKEEYIKVSKNPDPVDRESFACAYAKKYTGICGFGDHPDVCVCFPPNDAACTYVFSCDHRVLTGCNGNPNPQHPNAIIDDEGIGICRCPKTCEMARAGFATGPQPQDECTPQVAQTEGEGAADAQA